MTSASSPHLPPNRCAAPGRPPDSDTGLCLGTDWWSPCLPHQVKLIDLAQANGASISNQQGLSPPLLPDLRAYCLLSLS